MPCAPFAVDPILSAARTPPGAFYDDQALHRCMLEAFASAWQAVPDLPQPTRYDQLASTLLPGSLDEPLLVVHDGERERAFSNVCTHRGALLVDDRRRGKRIACPYHGRCFGLDGAVVTAPGFEGREGELPPLPELVLDRLGPLRWVAPPGTEGGVADFVRVLDQRAPGLPWAQAVARSDLAANYEVPAHWALYVENYLEGLHIPFVHPGLDAAVERDSYTTEPVEGGVLQTALARGDGPTLPGGAAALYLWLFPNTMLNVYPWGVSLNVVLPLTVGSCRVLFRSYVWDADLLDAGAGAGLDAVEVEDEAVVARVREGIGARLYDRGHYSDPAEAGVHQFHRLLTSFLWP